MNNATNTVAIALENAVDGDRAKALIARAMQLLIAEMQDHGECGDSTYSEEDFDAAHEIKFCANK